MYGINLELDTFKDTNSSNANPADDKSQNLNSTNGIVNNTTKKEFKLIEKIKNFLAKLFALIFLITSHKTCNKILLFFIIILSFWLLTFILIGSNALPGSTIFSLFVLISSAHVVGYLFAKLKMPDLFGEFY